jgi:hypothetical protein
MQLLAKVSNGAVGLLLGHSSPPCPSSLPLKLERGISRLWGLLIFAGWWPRRSPFGRAENPLIAFICKLKKQVRVGLVSRGEGQSAISGRAGVAHGRRFTHGRALPRRVQIALKPASKTLGLHGIFIRGKGLKDMIACRAFKREQVDTRAYRRDAGEPH